MTPEPTHDERRKTDEHRGDDRTAISRTAARPEADHQNREERDQSDEAQLACHLREVVVGVLALVNGQ